MAHYDTDAHLYAREQITGGLSLDFFATQLRDASASIYNGGGSGEAERYLKLPKKTRETLAQYRSDQIIDAISAELELLLARGIGDRLYVSSVYWRRPGRFRDGYVKVTYRPSSSTIARQAIPSGTIRGEVLEPRSISRW